MFHSYDIRGKYESQITIQTAYLLGVAYARTQKPSEVLVGYDARLHSDELANALIDGLIDEGVHVRFIGFCCTPMIWFGVSHFNLDGGIMVTASHNPKEYVGFKFCSKHSIPIGLTNGLKNIQKEYESILQNGIDHPKKQGVVTEQLIVSEYIHHILPFADKTENLKIVVDASNGVMGPILPELFENLNIDVVPLYFKPDGNFPNHSPNPMDVESRQELQKTIVAQKADLGILFDGDGDRVVFLDENGKPIPTDSVLYMIFTYLLSEQKKQTKQTVVYDLRMSMFLKEQVEKMDCYSIKTKVGRPDIIQNLVKHNGLVGGEVSGHYYFKDFYYCDDGISAMLCVLSYMSQQAGSVSQIIDSLNPYVQTGELNFTVHEDFSNIISIVKEKYFGEKIELLDGISVYSKDFWFNIRSSNTEPLIRLNLEADSTEILKTQKQKLLQTLGLN